jgi:MinD-like ATPase involved in chromosome partitioning or flagellar assembly
MNWHIITSSKGGVGKTLVSLMLLNSSCDAYLKRENNSYELAFDLNGMNADLRRMVATRSPVNANRLTSKDRRFHFEINRGRQYIVGWPLNSFRILTPESFFDLISKIDKSLKEELQQHFNCNIQTVIIDTELFQC